MTRGKTSRGRSRTTTTRSRGESRQNISSSLVKAVGGMLALHSFSSSVFVRAFDFKSEKNQASYEMEEEKFGPTNRRTERGTSMDCCSPREHSTPATLAET